MSTNKVFQIIYAILNTRLRLDIHNETQNSTMNNVNNFNAFNIETGICAIDIFQDIVGYIFTAYIVI